MKKTPVKILCIEESYEAHRKTKKMLDDISDFDISIDWISDWDDALDKIKRNNYDVCLLDHQLQGKNSLEFLNNANAFNLLTPIVFLSDSHSHENNGKAMEAGACDYIVKDDLDSNILERTIRHAIERKKYEFKIVEVTEELAIAIKDIKDNQSELIEIENLKSVKALAGAIAHEFAQPLQALSNYLSLIKSGHGDTLQYVNKAEDMIVRISDLTDNLRNITGLPKKDYLGSKILDLKLKSISGKHSKRTVLIVDDEDVILETLVDMFQIRGFKCDGTTNAKDALELIKQNQYDLIISDVSMPVMSGPDFFKQVKAMNINSAFIFITGYEVPEKIKNIISQADGLVVKPVSFDQLFDNLEQIGSINHHSNA
jgi:DNA-binding response OmpR family regulator